MRKRLIAGITIKNNLVVQSISYNKYLPLGKVEYFIKNLNRWSVDEILIRDIDAYRNKGEPNIKLIEKIKKISCETPIIYGGGISNFKLASLLFNYGIDRILIENLFYENPNQYEIILNKIGAQSIILSLSIKNGEIINYINKHIIKNIYTLLKDNLNPSEILVNDITNDGSYGKFNDKNLICVNKLKPKIICHGGLTNIKILKKILNNKNVSAVCISNYLNFKEHQYQTIKNNLNLNTLRKEIYE